MKALRTILCFAALGLLMAGTVTAGDVLKSAVRVSIPGGVGSGAIVKATYNEVTILTAAHVVAQKPACKVEFFDAGRVLAVETGQVLYTGHAYGRDVAVVVIRHPGLGKLLRLEVTPIAPRWRLLIRGQHFLTIGCPEGGPPTAFEGTCQGYDSEGRMIFTPAPKNGRSGSAILSTTNGRAEIVAVLVARDSLNRYGVGVPVTFEQHAASDVKGGEMLCQSPNLEWRVLDPVPAQCPGGRCDPQQLDRQPQRGLDPWPQLAPSLGDATPPVDLAPLGNKLDGIAALLQQRLSAPPVPPAPAGPDPQIVAALNQHSQQIGDLQTGLGNVAKVAQSTADNVAKHGTLLERFAAKQDGEAASGPLEKIKSDFSNQLGNQRNVFLTIGIVLAVLGIATFCVMHLISQFRPNIDAQAAANPNDPVIQAMASMVDKLDNTNQTLQKLPLLGALTGAVPGAAIPAAIGTAALNPATEAAIHQILGTVQGLVPQVQAAASNSAVAASTATPAAAT